METDKTYSITIAGEKLELTLQEIHDLLTPEAREYFEKVRYQKGIITFGLGAISNFY